MALLGRLWLAHIRKIIDQRLDILDPALLSGIAMRIVPILSLLLFVNPTHAATLEVGPAKTYSSLEKALAALPGDTGRRLVIYADLLRRVLLCLL